MTTVRIQYTILLTAVLFVMSSLAAAQFQSRTEPAPLSPPNTFNFPSMHPSIAGDGEGNWVAVWRVPFPFHVVAARSANNGATWSAPVKLDPDAGPDDNSYNFCPPAIATDGSGVWIAIWQAQDFSTTADLREVFVSRSTDKGATWSDPVKVNTTGQETHLTGPPHIATDGAGNWVAVYAGRSATFISPFKLQFVRSTDNGLSWSAAAPLDDDAGHRSFEYYPWIAADEDGNWIAVWGTRNLDDDEPTDRARVVAARSTDNGATWSNPAFISPKTSNDTLVSRIATDGEDNWVVVWVNLVEQGGDGNTFMASHSVNDGATWTPAVVIGSHAADFASSIATDSAGNWVAIWNVSNSGQLTLYTAVSRSSDEGATWTAPEPLANPSGGSRPHVVSDGAGAWIAVWEYRQILYTRWDGITEWDRDGDNFSDADELAAGTSSDTWDTDNDTLSDEEEVNIYNTSPLLEDTDGDGVWDVIEISLGTDTNDPFDFPTLPVTWGWTTAAIIGLAAVFLIGQARLRRRT